MNRAVNFRLQRGATIIAALLVVATVVTLAASLMAGQERWYRQVKLEGDRLQALALGDAAIDYGRAVLSDDERRGVTDHRDEAWAQPLPPMSVEGGLLTGSIEELQGRINLNSILTDAKPLQRLWEQLGLPPEQLNALADWVDADSDTRFPGGAEDQYYLGTAHPFRAANRPMLMLDELKSIRGFTANTVTQIREHVAVYPVGSAINANLASAVVLEATIPSLSRSQAQSLRRSGDREPFKSDADFKERLSELGWKGDNLPLLSVSSRHFMVRGEVQWGDASIRMAVAVERTGIGTVPRVLWKKME